MTGNLKIKKTSSGKQYFYIRLSYKDPVSSKWTTKDISTALTVKGNRRNAERMIAPTIEKFLYLESLPVYADNAVIIPTMEVSEFLESWLENKKCEIRENTYDGYRYRIGRIKQYFTERHILLCDVTPKVLDDFYKYSLAHGKINKKTHKEEPLSVRSVRSYKSLLHAALDDAVIRGLISNNPVKDTKVGNKSNREFSEQLLFLTDEEIAPVFSFLQEHYPYLVPIAFMGVYYGLRREEILGLKWSAIDFDHKRIIIRHTVTGSNKVYALDQTKTADGHRTLGLFPSAMERLKRVRENQEANRTYYGNAYHDTHDYVFTADDGTPYRPDYITKKFSKAMREFGRQEITLHKLRYTCASKLIDLGWDVKKVQHWLGDHDASTVMNIYAQYVRHKDNMAEAGLEEIAQTIASIF